MTIRKIQSGHKAVLAFALALAIVHGDQAIAQSGSRGGGGTALPGFAPVPRANRPSFNASQGSGATNRGGGGGLNFPGSGPFGAPAGGAGAGPAAAPQAGRPADEFDLPDVPPLSGEQQAAQQFGSRFDLVVDEKFIGWRQASDGSEGNRLDDVLRAQWVMADTNGQLSGTVYGTEGADLGNLKIYLLRSGIEVASVTPREDGTFIFPNVEQGVYALIGWGDNAFFAFGFNILQFNPTVDANVSTELVVTATQNQTTINTDWIRSFASKVNFPRYGVFETGEGEGDPSRLYGLQGQRQFLPPSRPATSISSHEVIPSTDGRLVGRIHQINSTTGRPVELRGTRVILLKDDDVFAAVSADKFGIFTFRDIPAGEYACLAAGKDGVGCIGIYLGEPAKTVEEFAPISLSLTPSEATGWLNSFADNAAYQRVISRPRPQPEPEQPPSFFGPAPFQGPYALRPGGYRPPPRSAIPKDQRFFRRANRFIDRLFFPDDSGGQFGGGVGANSVPPFSGNVPFSSPAGVVAPAAVPGGAVGGSTSRNQVPNLKRN